MRTLILNGDLKEGTPLPSMRNLAKELQVSVITTKRAYEELEKEGLIDSIVGKGSYVAEQQLELMKERRLRALEEQLIDVIQASKDVGIDRKELVELLELLYEE
ncbi:MAG TPA: GntR family transcriptional regulator [Savagea sp.]